MKPKCMHVNIYSQVKCLRSSVSMNVGAPFTLDTADYYIKCLLYQFHHIFKTSGVGADSVKVV